jgi:hypothetical protein
MLDVVFFEVPGIIDDNDMFEFNLIIEFNFKLSELSLIMCKQIINIKNNRDNIIIQK